MAFDHVYEKYQPTFLDLVLASIAAIAMPIIAGYLFDFIGAFVPMAIYYGFFAILIVRWRRGSLDYQIHWGNVRKQFRSYLTPLFVVLFLLQTILVITSWFTLIRVEILNPIGWILTLVIWAPINAFSEQLIWLYTFDSFAEYYKEGRKRSIMVFIGGALYIALIGMIHVLFWAKFLLESSYLFIFTQIFFIIQFIIPIGYIFLYRRTGSMWPLGIIHVFLNLTGVLFSGYSILPYLLIIG
ncbi:MAG: hypothetical protein AM325_001205 [Candidatus Thorarchaeota archaeon SMTZ1-45]|nr:MAG: hypothetical protein AM325_03025 [Candidatus Thorarchaeota archaeon SMTZ1-45]